MKGIIKTSQANRLRKHFGNALATNNQRQPYLLINFESFDALSCSLSYTWYLGNIILQISFTFKPVRYYIEDILSGREWRRITTATYAEFLKVDSFTNHAHI